MTKILDLACALLLIAALGLTAPALATNEMARAEGLACTVCHDKPGSRLMTDKGLYYETVGSLEGYDDIVAAFRECTTCHVKKPGSKKLTERGRRYSWAVGDMEELRQWLLARHPQPAEEPEGEQPAEGRGGGGGAPAR